MERVAEKLTAKDVKNIIETNLQIIRDKLYSGH